MTLIDAFTSADEMNASMLGDLLAAGKINSVINFSAALARNRRMDGFLCVSFISFVFREQ